MDCPKCNRELPASEINVRKDIAHCTSCNHVFKISEHLGYGNEDDDQLPSSFDPQVTPDKITHERLNNEIKIVVSLKSKKAFFLIPFTLVWSGMSMGMLYFSQIANQEFDPFKTVFGLPFLFGTIFLVGIILRSIAGKTEITLNNQGGEAFTGVGTLGIKKKWRWDEVHQIVEGSSNVRVNGTPLRTIRLEGQNLVKIGLTLKGEQSKYVLRALQYYLKEIQRRNYII